VRTEPAEAAGAGVEAVETVLSAPAIDDAVEHPVVMIISGSRSQTVRFMDTSWASQRLIGNGH
jgi:serine protease inhibitor